MSCQCQINLTGNAIKSYKTNVTRLEGDIPTIYAIALLSEIHYHSN